MYQAKWFSYQVKAPSSMGLLHLVFFYDGKEGFLIDLGGNGCSSVLYKLLYISFIKCHIIFHSYFGSLDNIPRQAYYAP